MLLLHCLLIFVETLVLTNMGLVSFCGYLNCECTTAAIDLLWLWFLCYTDIAVVLIFETLVVVILWLVVAMTASLVLRLE